MVLPDGESYDARFEALARQGQHLHGEADLVAWLLADRPASPPPRVLDAGCGTGRVAIELADRGFEVVGIDVDRSMLDRARLKAPTLPWHLGDLTDPIPDGPYDLIVMAGNVLLFTRPGTEPTVVARLAAVLAPGGLLVAGFSLREGGYGTSDYDGTARACDLELVHRWATWAHGEWLPGTGYAVSVHRGPGHARPSSFR